MKRMGIIRFVLLGAAGFGVSGAIAAASWPLAVITFGASALLFILSGAVGGASLGLALRDRRKLVALALLGALGTFLGLLMATILGSFVNYSMMLIVLLR